MSITIFAVLIAAAGALGGLATSVLNGERFIFPRYDEELKVRRTGWVGNVFIGAIASIVVWAIYGSLANFDLNRGDFSQTNLPLFQLGSSIIVGLSGGKILTSLAQQKADQIARDNLASLSKKLNKPKQ